MWKIEPINKTEGGYVNFHKKIRFRHMQTGLYLAVEGEAEN